MCNDKKNTMKKNGDDDMSTTIESKPIKSTEINFKTDKECIEFAELIKDPPAPSDFVKDLIEKYKEQRETK